MQFMKDSMSRVLRLAAFGFLFVAVSTVVGGNTMAQSQKGNSAASTDHNWLITNKDYAGHRFVNLRQINKNNVANWKPVCTYDIGRVKQE